MRIKPDDTHAPHVSPLSWWYWTGIALILLLLGLAMAMSWPGGWLAAAGWAAQLLFAASVLAAVLWVIGGVALHRASKLSAGLAGQPATRGESACVDGHPVPRGSQQDITELATVREALRAAHEDYRFLFERNPLPMWVFDRTSLNFLAVNEAAVEHYGYSREQFLSKGLRDIRPASELDAFEASIRCNQSEQGRVWTHCDANDRRLRMAIYSRDTVFNGAPARLVLAQDVTELEAIQQRFELVARATSDVIWDWDLGDNTLWWSGSFYSTFGYDRDAMPPTLEVWSQLLHPDDHDAVMASLDAAIADPGIDTWESEYRFLHCDGGYRDVLDRGFILRDADGQATRAVGGMLDISEKHRAESEMRLLQRTVESVANGICIVDMQRDDHPIVYVNPAFEQMTGYAAHEVIGRNCRFLQGPARDEAAMDEIHEALRTEQPVQVVLKNYRKDRTPFWNELRLSPVRDDGGALRHYVGIQNDVSERYRLESKLAYAASHDTLTGLVNRAELRQHLERVIADSSIAQHSAALLFIDLDNFNLINDSLGHETGDAVLQEVARRLRGATRSSDLVARFGGDEFVALLQARGASPLNMGAVIDRIQSEFLTPIQLDGKDHYITASIGYVRLPDGEVSAETLLIHADLAMYKAKQMGRNRAMEYSPGFGVGISDRLNLISQIGEGLRLGQFVLHYQPIMQADGGAVGLEALVRWQHPERGLLPPAAFIDECETSGLIVPLGRWVMREAARFARTLLDAAITEQTLRMSVNVSVLQLQNSLLEDVTEVIHTFNLPEGSFELELTESSLMGNADEAIKVMVALRAFGVEIAIDDFGTGYSSLAYLKRLPINRLKIDRSFVKDLPDDAEDAAICRSVIRLAHNLGLRTVAEGVETTAHRDFLESEGCDELQGYLFARPMPMDELLTWLRDAGSRVSA